MKKPENPYEQKINQFNSKLNEKNKKKPQDDKKNPSKITINVSECQYPVVRLVAKKLKWNISTEPVSNLNFDLCWIDGHCRQEIFARMQPYQKINHFPGMEILSRKNFLGKSLMQFRKKFPEDYDFFPITWSLPTEFNDLKQYHQNRQQGKAQTFICKPQASCQGRGIFLTRNIDKVKYEKCVVQRYMSKPFLIEGLKFDLRIYVLIAGTDPLRIFVYNEGLARLCTQPYEMPKSDNLDNKFMHLTNYAINKLSPNFIFNQQATQCNKGHKRSLSSIYKTLEQLGHSSQQIKQRIYDMLIKTIVTGYPNLSRFQQGSHPQNFANDMCFQILGFDVILNHKLIPNILEVNYTPSFTTDTPFDKMVKKNLIYDTLKLLNVTQKWKREVRKKRELQLKERMLSGKRTKYTPQQRQQLAQKYAKLRDEYQAQHLGGFTKIFCQSEQQMLKYAHFYEFAEQLYQKQNKLTGVSISKSFQPFYMPFAKSPKNNQIQKQFSRTGAFSSTKIMARKLNTRQQTRGPKSIEGRKIISSAKQMPPRIAGGIQQYSTVKTVSKNQQVSNKNNNNNIHNARRSLNKIHGLIEDTQPLFIKSKGTKTAFSNDRLELDQQSDANSGQLQDNQSLQDSDLSQDESSENNRSLSGQDYIKERQVKITNL